MTHSNCQERIAKEESGLELIVRSLARKAEESTCALKLILELSKSDEVQSLIGRVQGCILLVVTMSSGDDVQAAGYAQEILQNLSCLEQNVIQMARANYFGPMLQLLCSGILFPVFLTMSCFLKERTIIYVICMRMHELGRFLWILNMYNLKAQERQLEF